MTVKFAIINPANGTYTMADSPEERDTLLAATAWQFYLTHTHNSPYSIVSLGEDGSEMWSSPSGEPVMSPAELEALVAQ